MDVDEFLGIGPARAPGLATSLLLRLLFRGRRPAPDVAIPLRHVPSAHVKGLRLIERGEGEPFEEGLVVGTVRMGYGHHRMAYSAYTWALALGHRAYLHDLLAIESEEASVLRDLDRRYSFFSRLAASFGGPVDWLWGKITSRGNVDSLRLSCAIARELRALARAIPNGLPFVASYPLNGQIAVASGFRRVVNLVPDNYPQYFVLVPGALNLVQSPAAYTRFREMGVPASHLGVAGHWVSHAIAANARRDSELRMKRARDRRPRRLLVPIGGAGAQGKFVAGLLRGAARDLRSGKVRLFLNVGDHRTLFDSLTRVLADLGIEFEPVRDWASLLAFCGAHELALADPPGEKPATVFHFDSHFEAFAATEHLIRVSDVLATKPSELAFYPIPKLFLRRVGEHESGGVRRALEIGDGTVECRSLKQARGMLALFTAEDDLLFRMNEAVIGGAARGVYEGSRVAVEAAIGMR